MNELPGTDLCLSGGGTGWTPLRTSGAPTQNQELRYQLDNLENRSRCSYICIKGVLLHEVSGNLEEFVTRLFHHVTPALADQEIICGHTHRPSCRSSTPGQGQGILTCLRYYRQKETIMAAAQDHSGIEFEGLKLWLYQDLSPITLQ
ncbi:hypothetical protein NDU88_002907 [Pleurodeles waltl]|uniref:Calcineurin-like phosphoesterase domain-containing protein n=1 Tax=Pleurodeles waltl TaxID=8319 RepID=A0AAV7MCE3_PLEWA|nr:hypothetical protein NDU88_002907 [Pleurodeles waltl]